MTGTSAFGFASCLKSIASPLPPFSNALMIKAQVVKSCDFSTVSSKMSKEVQYVTLRLIAFLKSPSNFTNSSVFPVSYHSSVFWDSLAIFYP